MFAYPILRRGDRGRRVEILQRALNEANASSRLPINGNFGPQTQAEVTQFQESHLVDDAAPHTPSGVVDEETWRALGVELSELLPIHIPGLRGRRIVRIASEEALRGVRETGTNTGPDVRMYQASTSTRGTGWRWCAAFVTWVYETAGLYLRDAGGFINVTQLRLWAESTGRWFPRDSGYYPPAGSIVIFNFSHTGIIVQSHDSYDVTIEGNTSSGETGSQADGEGVYQRRRNHSLIRGYVVLDEILAPPGQNYTPVEPPRPNFSDANQNFTPADREDMPF